MRAFQRLTIAAATAVGDQRSQSEDLGESHEDRYLSPAWCSVRVNKSQLPVCPTSSSF